MAGGCYFLGGFGRLYGDRVNVAADGYDAIIPAMLENLSPLLIGIVVILVLSASMSTLSSLVMASSSTLTLDLLKDNVVKDMDEKKQVLTMRALIVVFIAISVVIAIVQHKSNITFIAQLMGVSWGALAGAFPRPLPLRALLEAHHPRGGMGQLPLRRGRDDAEPLLPVPLPVRPPVAHQLRRVRHARGIGAGAAGEPHYPRGRSGN